MGVVLAIVGSLQLVNRSRHISVAPVSFQGVYVSHPVHLNEPGGGGATGGCHGGLRDLRLDGSRAVLLQLYAPRGQAGARCWRHAAPVRHAASHTFVASCPQMLHNNVILFPPLDFGLPLSPSTRHRHAHPDPLPFPVPRPRLDHVSIYVYIAGTFTPFCVISLQPALGEVTFFVSKSTLI